MAFILESLRLRQKFANVAHSSF